MNAILFLMSFLLLAFGIAVIISNHIGSGYYEKTIVKAVPISAIIASVILFIFSCSFTIVPTGYTGVRSVFGQINKDPAPNGFNWKIPFVESIEKVNNKQQDVLFEEKVWSETSNRTAIYYADITVTYQISPDRATWIYANVTDYDDNLVTSSLVASAIKSCSKTLMDADATNRSKIEKLSMESLQSSLDSKYGKNTITINKVVIGKADFEKSYNEAIAAKQKAQLEYEKQAIENKKSIEKAEADAKVKRTNAQAEADANKLLEKSLTNGVLQSKMLDKWNGELPKVTNGNSMLNISDLMK